MIRGFYPWLVLVDCEKRRKDGINDTVLVCIAVLEKFNAHFGHSITAKT